MEKTSSRAGRFYEDFEPPMEWAREAGANTLIVHLPGFGKEQLKVQVTTTPTLRISGERSLGCNKRSRFVKETAIPSNCDPCAISAKFEKGMLYVKHPSIIAPAIVETIPIMEQPPPIMETPKPQQEKVGLPMEPPLPRPVQTPTEIPTEAPKPQQEKVELLVEPPTPQTPPKERVQPPIEVQFSLSIKPPQEKTEMPTEAPEPQKPAQEKKQPPVETQPEKDKHAIGKSGSDKLTTENQKQDFGGLKLESLSKPGNLINLILAILLVVVIGLYTMNEIRSLRKSDSGYFVGCGNWAVCYESNHGPPKI